MNIKGTATGAAYGSDLATPLMFVFVFVLIICGVIGGCSAMTRESNDCHALGGIYVDTRSAQALCIRDGAVVKMY